MSPRTKITIYGVVQEFGLNLEYVDDFPDNVYGQLDSSAEPLFIAVKRNLPECEEVFTIAHELGHYFLHPSFKPRREHMNWFMRRQWNYPPLARIANHTRRFYRRRLNCEWDADLWAMSFLLTLGDVRNLNAYLVLHPEKTNLCLLAALVAFCKGIPRLGRGIFRRLFDPFHTI